MITLKDRGPKVAELALASLEASLSSPLPADYREFLIASNGGVPTPNTIDIEGFPESPTDVQVLFGLGRSIESSCVDWNQRVLAQRLDRDLVPIACDSGGSVFCLSLGASNKGAILYCDLQAVFADYESKPRCYAVAPTFESFLGKLRPFQC